MSEEIKEFYKIVNIEKRSDGGMSAKLYEQPYSIILYDTEEISELAVEFVDESTSKKKLRALETNEKVKTKAENYFKMGKFPKEPLDRIMEDGYVKHQTKLGNASTIEERTEWLKEEILKREKNIRTHEYRTYGNSGIAEIEIERQLISLPSIKTFKVKVLGKKTIFERLFPGYEKKIGIIGSYFVGRNQWPYPKVHNSKDLKKIREIFESSEDIIGIYNMDSLGQESIIFRTKFAKPKENIEVAEVIDSILSKEFTYYESKLNGGDKK